MIELTDQQRQEVESTGRTRVLDTATEQEYILLRKDFYERLQAIVEDDSLNPEQVGRLVEQTMREYDEDDPLLDSYQKYRR